MIKQRRESEIGTPKNTEPVCLFCEGSHWGDQCTSYNSIAKRRQFLSRKDNALIVDEPAIARTNVELEGVLSAEVNITPAFVIKSIKVVSKLITTQR